MEHIRGAGARLLGEGRRRPWATAGVLVAAALLVVHLCAQGEPLGGATYLPLSAGVCALAWWGAHRRSQRRGVARLVAAGLTLSALGDATFYLRYWSTGSAATVSAADASYLASYLVLLAALVGLLRGHRALSRESRSGLVDVGVALVLSVLLVAEASVASSAEGDDLPLLSRAVLVAYPVLDVVLIAVVVRLVTARRGTSRMTALLAAGAGCWLVADFAYLLIASAETYTAWLDAGWLVGSLLLALSSFQAPPVAQPPACVADDGVGLGRLAWTFAPLLVPVLLDLRGHLGGDGGHPSSTVAATLALVALAFTRAAGLLRSAAAARTLLRSQERYASALAANSSDAVLVLDAQGRVVNHAWRLPLVMGRAVPAVGDRALDLVEPEDQDEVAALFARALAAPGQVFERDLRVRHGSGSTIWVAGRLINLLHDPDVAALVVNVRDITARKLAEQELVHRSFHDGLTGLANRELFRDRTAQALRRAARSGVDPVVLVVGLAGVGAVSDGHGHEAGDQLLRAVAERLLDAVRSEDTVARLSGDEFAVLLERSSRGTDESAAMADRLMQVLSAPIDVDGELVELGASVGVAVAGPGSSAASLLREAAVAMSRARAAGPGAVLAYEAGMGSAAAERVRLRADLTAAVEDGQLRLFYQPVVDLSTGAVRGFEALVRWQHPELGLLTPDRFIPLAEDSGQVVALGRWVLERACRTAARWRREHPAHRDLTIAVNVSARQLADGGLRATVAAALDDCGLPPSAVVLELTETVLVHDPELVARRLRDLRDLGVRLAVDDFGTGYSSLSHLRQFPMDILKIDRSFVETITDADVAPPIVRGLLDLGRALGLETVAEGVETEAQRALLGRAGCDHAQGYLFARPLAEADAEALLTGVPVLRAAAPARA